MPRRAILSLLILLSIAIWAAPCSAKVQPSRWGITLTAADSLSIKSASKAYTDSLLGITGSKARAVIFSIQRYRLSRNLTPDFYLLCGLFLLLGAIRYLDPRYFALLVGAYRNPGTGRQWHDMLKAAALPNLGMNIFFAAVAGAYIYYLSSGANHQLPGVRSVLVLPLLITGMLLIYAAKYAAVRFSGWAFRAEALAEQYLFNVFLVNKITAIVLLPFVVIIAFAGREWLQPIGAVSGVVVVGLLATRYLRSWPLFVSFFQGSRFHFFTYLCASEILPMAVLVKWLLHLLR